MVSRVLSDKIVEDWMMWRVDFDTVEKLRLTTDDDRAEKLMQGFVNKDEHVYLRNAKKFYLFPE